MVNTLDKNIWIQYSQKKPEARIRLICFPYAGGGASIFRTWSKALPAQIEVWPIQLPGRENRLAETPFTCMPDLIEALALALRPSLTGAYAFFGHSMGSLICFELARYLRAQGHMPGPVHLFVSGHRAPHLPDPDVPSYNLPEPEFVNELQRLNGTPEAVLQNEELLHLLMPLLRADFSICETYIYQRSKALSCPLTAFGGLQDQDTPRDAIASWREHTSGSFKQRFFPGNHFFLETEQSSLLLAIIQELADFLR